MHEIITLQLGQASNYLGAHFWNAQESYFTYGNEAPENGHVDSQPSPINHDVHFRSGLGVDGKTETYMPRTVVYDLKGGFGSMRKINALYDDSGDDGQHVAMSNLWKGQATVQKQDPIPLSAYQESLEVGASAPELTKESVRYWSDFNRVFFHPRSIVQLNDYELNSTTMPFQKWDMGLDLFASLDRDHDIADRDLRPFIEEADQMQGIQVLTGLDDAWAGFAARYLERLRDEYGKIPIWVWGSQEPVKGVAKEKRLMKLVNKAHAIVEMYSHASLLIPLAVPFKMPSSVTLDTSSSWHVSALFHAALESTSLFTRLRSPTAAHMSDLTNMLNVFGGQRIANLQMSHMDLSYHEETGTNTKPTWIECGNPTARPTAFSPQSRQRSHLGEDRIANEKDFETRDDVADLSIDLSSLDEGMNRSDGVRRSLGARKAYLFSQICTTRGNLVQNGSEEVSSKPDKIAPPAAYHRHSKTRRLNTDLAYPLLDSHPLIFNSRNGNQMHSNKDYVGMRTTLSADSSVTKKMRALRTTVSRSLDLQDREDIGNQLAGIADDYVEGWDDDWAESDNDDY